MHPNQIGFSFLHWKRGGREEEKELLFSVSPPNLHSSSRPVQPVSLSLTISAFCFHHHSTWTPQHTRIFLSYVLVFNVMILLVGQNLISFKVQYSVEALMKVVEKGKVFNYSLWKGITELYKDDLNALASLLLVFSGIWPHVKLLLLLAGIQRNVSPAMHTMFKWLCTMGKWSFLDGLVVCLIVVVFRVDIKGSVVLGETMYSGWLAAAAGEGLYLFTLAIFISQILGKTIVLTSKGDHYSSDRLRRSKQRWTLAGELSAIPRFMVALGVLLTGITMITAQLSPCYSVESEVDFKYYFPLYHRQLQNETHSIISGWETAWQANQMGTPNRALTILGCFLVTAMPITEVLLLLTLCFANMSNTWHQRCAQLLQLVSDWACLDVFMVVLLVAKAQTPILANKLNKNFHVSLTIMPASYALVGSVVSLMAIRTYMQYLHKAALKKRCGYIAVDANSDDSVEQTELQEQSWEHSSWNVDLEEDMGSLLVQSDEGDSEALI